MVKHRDKIVIFGRDYDLYFIAGIFFLLLQILVAYVNIGAGRFNVLFWFCNHSLLIFGIAFLIRNDDIIKSMINVGFLAQLLWTLDFFAKLIFGVYLTSVTQYIFEEPEGIFVLVPILVHIVAINFALVLTYKKKMRRRTLLYSLVYVLLLYLISLSYPDKSQNLNCIYNSCGVFASDPVYYTVIWPILAFVLVILPTYWIQHLLFRLNKRKV